MHRRVGRANAAQQSERVHALPLTREHGSDSIEALIVGVADRRGVLEKAAFVSFLHEHRHGKVVGVEVPGEELSRVKDVGGQACERIGVAVQFWDLEAVGEEACEFGSPKHHVGGTAWLPRVAGNEATRALKEGVDRMVVRELVVDPGVEVRVHHLGREMRGVLAFDDLVVQQGHRFRPDEIFHDGAADRAESLAGGSNRRGVGGGLRFVQRITIKIDDLGKFVHRANVNDAGHG